MPPATDIRIIAPSGEIDLDSARALQSRLSEAVGDASHELLLDLSSVTFMDSTALGAVVQAAERLRRQGRNLTLVVVAPSTVSTLLEVSGLRDRFPIFGDRDRAVAYLEQATAS